MHRAFLYALPIQILEKQKPLSTKNGLYIRWLLRNFQRMQRKREIFVAEYRLAIVIADRPLFGCHIRSRNKTSGNTNKSSAKAPQKHTSLSMISVWLAMEDKTIGFFGVCTRPKGEAVGKDEGEGTCVMGKGQFALQGNGACHLRNKNTKMRNIGSIKRDGIKRRRCLGARAKSEEAAKSDEYTHG